MWDLQERLTPSGVILPIESRRLIYTAPGTTVDSQNLQEKLTPCALSQLTTPPYDSWQSRRVTGAQKTGHSGIRESASLAATVTRG